MKYALRPYQELLVKQVFQHWANGRKRVLMQSGTGTGKCLVKGTKVLMYNGGVKPVEDVVPGDVLMGEDSTPRNVLSTCTGSEMCYDIVPVKGEKWGCNESHILSLVSTGGKGRFKRGQVYDIPLREYIGLCKSAKHVLKQYRTGVSFPETSETMPIDPYFLGLWLGDGNQKTVQICNPEIEIYNYILSYCNGDESLFYNCEKRKGMCKTWFLPASKHKKLHDTLRSMGLFKSKFIPECYKVGSRETRLKLLAGLLDTDGFMNKGGFEIIAKSDRLAADILFLARSLGFSATLAIKNVRLENWSESRPYNRIAITGHCDEIPLLVERKKATARRQIKSVLRTGFTVVPRGIEQYYGFEIDGNRRFVLGDFTVTHNTVVFNHIVSLAEKKGKRVLVIADRRELIMQAWQRLWDAHGIHAGIIMSGQPHSYQLPVQIASIQTLNRRNFPPDIDLVIIDECRASVSPSYAPIFAFYSDSHFLGVDATPVRTSGMGFDHLYNEMVVGPSIKTMEAAGALVPAKYYINPINQSSLDKLSMTAGDYNEKELAKLMSEDRVTADLVASKLKWAKGLKTIVFAVNIEHSKAVIAQYVKAGISAAHVDGEMSIEDRARIFANFKSGRIEVLCNVGIATYGFDEPTLQVVQLARPTKSLALYLQMIGRGTRPCKEIGKEHYILLDHANCIMEHGTPNAERKWSLKGKDKVKKKQPPKQFRLRGDGIDMIATARDFPSEMEGVTLEEIDEATILFWSNCKEFDKIHESIRRGGKKPILAYLRYVSKHREKCGINELRYIERKLGFKPGFAEIRYRQLNER